LHSIGRLDGQRIVGQSFSAVVASAPVKPAPFEYHRPSSAVEAVELLAALGEEAKVLGGGQSLIPMLALRLTAFEHLVDIGRIDEIVGIERRGDAVWIGAGTTEAAVERSDDVARAVPLVARATPFIGHVQIRNRGTVGGSLAHADPAAEYPAVALVLDADFESLSPRGTRTVPAGEFFTGLWSTALEPDELLTGVTFPVWSGRCGFAVEEIARRHGDFAIAGATVAIELDGGDRVQRCGIGLIGMGSTPERARNAEAEATGRPIDEVDPGELGRAAVADLGSIPSDLHGSATYREQVGATMVARAWRRAVEEARGV
jgi:carbon-monoxide dehydrogenase medium subunit